MCLSAGGRGHGGLFRWGQEEEGRKFPAASLDPESVQWGGEAAWADGSPGEGREKSGLLFGAVALTSPGTLNMGDLPLPRASH